MPRGTAEHTSVTFAAGSGRRLCARRELRGVREKDPAGGSVRGLQ